MLVIIMCCISAGRRGLRLGVLAAIIVEALTICDELREATGGRYQQESYLSNGCSEECGGIGEQGTEWDRVKLQDTRTK